MFWQVASTFIDNSHLFQLLDLRHLLCRAGFSFRRRESFGLAAMIAKY